MPILPHLYPRRATASLAQDTRALDSRQTTPPTHRLLSHLLQPRQSGNGNDGRIVAIPTVYQGLNAGPSPGVVVAIVLGSIAAFLLLIWLLWAVSSGSGFIFSSSLDEEDVVVRRHRGSNRSNNNNSNNNNNNRSRSRSRRRSPGRAEMASRSPVRRVERERVIRQERIVRDINPPREASRIRETIIMEDARPERRVDGDDIVEVIEEHSSVGGGAPPRRKSRRSGGAGGYRLVDPSPRAGGGYAQREVRA